MSSGIHWGILDEIGGGEKETAETVLQSLKQQLRANVHVTCLMTAVTQLS